LSAPEGLIVEDEQFGYSSLEGNDMGAERC
jgi:hypothetical protein